MSDKYEEMAREIVAWQGLQPENLALRGAFASALRQVERETLERHATIASQINDELSGVSMSYGTRTRVGELLLKLVEEYRLSPTPNELPTTQELADVSTPVKLIDRDQAIIATSVEADFEKGTWTFEPKGQWSVGAGDYYLIPIKAAEKGE